MLYEVITQVKVPAEQLSWAIGKKGQNVRLAAKLTGWRIDVLSDEDEPKTAKAESGESVEESETEDNK